MKKTLQFLALVAVTATVSVLVVRKLDKPTDGFGWQMAPAPAARFVSSETSSPAGTPDFRVASKRILQSVVSIDAMGYAETWFGDRVAQGGQGSGVILSAQGYIVTNNHVIRPNKQDIATEITVHTADGKTFPAKVVGTDPRSDLAVLKVEATGLVPAQVGSSKALEVGQWVIAAGNPLGFENTISVGVVSSLGRALPTEGSDLVGAIQTDAAINPGNSGGALIDASGNLVGINTAIATPNQGSVGIGFAIPSDRVKKIVDDIMAFGRAKYGQLGVGLVQRPGILQRQGVRQQIAEYTGAEPPQQGIIVDQVGEGSPAAGIGIKRASILMELDGTPLKETIDYSKIMADKRPGDKISIKFWTAGAVKTASVTLVDLGQ